MGAFLSVINVGVILYGGDFVKCGGDIDRANLTWIALLVFVCV